MLNFSKHHIQSVLILALLIITIDKFSLGLESYQFTASEPQIYSQEGLDDPINNIVSSNSDTKNEFLEENLLDNNKKIKEADIFRLISLLLPSKT
jgi:hypothetical protein